jgi:hypothetical protein
MAICTWCEREMTSKVTCTVSTLHRSGTVVEMIPWGRERGWTARVPCHDCGTPPGGFHHLGCDIQECAVCHGQMIGCGCRYDEDGPGQDDDGDADVWEPFIDANGCVTERIQLAGEEVIVHYDDLPAEDVTVLGGIPVTTPLRTAIDLAPTLTRPELERMVDDMLRRRLFTLAEARRRLNDEDMIARPGAQILRRLLFG